MSGARLGGDDGGQHEAVGALPWSNQGGSPSLGARMGTLLGTSGSDQNQTENTQKALEPKNNVETNFPIEYEIKNATKEMRDF